LTWGGGGIVIDCAAGGGGGGDHLATAVCEGRVKDWLGYGNRVGVNGMQEDMARELESKLARAESELAQVKSELALLKPASATYVNIRRMFLAMFKKNFFLPKMKQSDWDDIHQGNLEVHASDLISDAKLFMNRGDFWLFEDLYGVSPLGALQLEGTDACTVITSYATIRAEYPRRPHSSLTEAFNAFIALVKEAEYECTTLSDPTSAMVQAYSRFWDERWRLSPLPTY